MSLLNLYTNKLRTLAADFPSYLTRVFSQGSKFSYLKFAVASVCAVWGLHTIAKNYGLLSKKSIKDVHIFLTGAGGGIGSQLAVNLAKLGAKMSIVDLDFEAVKAIEQLLKEQNLQAKAIFCDVSNFQSVKEAAKVARDTFGDVEILINNAGVLYGRKILESDEKMFERTIQVNTVAHFYTVKEFLPSMVQKNRGHIVTISSAGGTLGVSGFTDYCTSKFGSFGFDESLRMELRNIKSNVKTSCICPYYVDTGMAKGVKSRFPWIFPILKEDYTIKRITNAILQEEKVVIFPFSCSLIFLMRALLPIGAFDSIASIIGDNPIPPKSV